MLKYFCPWKLIDFTVWDLHKVYKSLSEASRALRKEAEFLSPGLDTSRLRQFEVFLDISQLLKQVHPEATGTTVFFSIKNFFLQILPLLFFTLF